MRAPGQLESVKRSTTRAQKQQQVSDRFINENTVALENNAQALTRFTTDLEQKFITKLGEFTEAVTAMGASMNRQANAASQRFGGGGTAVGSAGGRRAKISPGPNKGG